MRNKRFNFFKIYRLNACVLALFMGAIIACIVFFSTDSLTRNQRRDPVGVFSHIRANGFEHRPSAQSGVATAGEPEGPNELAEEYTALAKKTDSHSEAPVASDKAGQAVSSSALPPEDQSGPGNTENTESSEAGAEDISGKRQTCRIKELGLKFTCDLDWGVRKTEDGTSFIILSRDPLITLSFGKLEDPIRFVEQLSKDFFKKKEMYQDNLKTEYINFAGHKAVRVNAFARNNPDIRHVDYFYVMEGDLYGINFSLFPKAKWNEGQFIIREVADSFEPI